MSPSSKGDAAIFAAAMRVRTRVAASLAWLGDCKLLNMLFMFVVFYFCAMTGLCCVENSWFSCLTLRKHGANLSKSRKKFFNGLFVNPNERHFLAMAKKFGSVERNGRRARMSNDE